MFIRANKLKTEVDSLFVEVKINVFTNGLTRVGFKLTFSYSYYKMNIT